MTENNPQRNYVYESTAEYSTFEVQFPNTPDFELTLIGAELYQDIEQHDRLVLHFKGKPENRETSIFSEDPVKFTYITEKVKSEFLGYVYEIIPKDGADSNNTDIICVSASYVLKNTDQKIYKNVTADQVVSKIAKKNGMKAVTQRHPRVRKMIVEAGQSDWQVCRRLAKQTGFALRSEGTTIYFVSKNKIFSKSKPSARYFEYIDSEIGGSAVKYNRSYGTILSFSSEISDNSPELGSKVDRVITGYNERTGKVIETLHKLKDFNFEDKGVVVPSEEFFEDE
jgi:hypothetical protein